jgi:hypothetical protein
MANGTEALFRAPPATRAAAKAAGALGLALLVGCAARPPAARSTSPTFASDLATCEIGDLAGPPATEGLAVDERALCEGIAKSARIDVADAPGGVTVTFTPRSPKDASKLRASLVTFERALDARWLEHDKARGHDRCELLDLAILGGRASTDYLAGSARMRITTSDPLTIPALRKAAQRFATSEGARAP